MKNKKSLSCIYVDLGSSSTKVYIKEDTLRLESVKSIKLKEGFTVDNGFAEDKLEEIFQLLEEVKKRYPSSRIKMFATSLFRKMSSVAFEQIRDKCFIRTGLVINVISQELENFFLEKALVGKANIKENILLINIGGDSTELVVMYGNEAIERKNLDMGVGTLLNQFPAVNESFSKVKISEIVNFVKDSLPVLENKCKIAMYSGGELNYMKLAQYPLEQNVIFKDVDHPFSVTTSQFARKNEAIFSKVALDELENLMPDNPKWMHGARICSALAQAIVENYGVDILIPSDSNLIDGVVRQEYRYVTLSGSFRKHLDIMIDVKEQLEKKNVIVLSPRFVVPKNPKEEFVVFEGEEGLTPLELEKYHLESIKKSDALIVCDPLGYVGASALIEIGYAYALGKRIIFTEKPEEFMLNTLPMEVGI